VTAFEYASRASASLGGSAMNSSFGMASKLATRL
jgi:hypothetical protein